MGINCSIWICFGSRENKDERDFTILTDNFRLFCYFFCKTLEKNEMAHYLNKFKYTYESFKRCKIGENWIDVESFESNVNNSQDLEDLLFALNQCKNEITNLPELMTMDYLDKIYAECNNFGYEETFKALIPTKSKSLIKLIDIIIEFLIDKDTALTQSFIYFEGYVDIPGCLSI